MKQPHYLAILLLATFGITLAPPLAQAADGTWNVDADGNWSDSANWTPVAVPGGAGTTIDLTKVITADRTVTIDTTLRTAGTLNIDSGSSSLKMVLAASDGGYLLMDNNGAEAVIQLGSSSSSQPTNSHLITAPIQIATGGLVTTAYGVNVNIDSDISAASPGTKVLRVGLGSGNPYFTGVISDGSGEVALLNDTASGTITFLRNTNTFTGGVTVQEGAVRALDAAGYGTGAITLGTASSTGTVSLYNSGTNTYGNNIVVSSAPASDQAKITTALTSDITYTGNVDMQKALRIEASHAGSLVTFTGEISGAGDLSTAGSTATGRVILTGSNSYTGTTQSFLGSLLINGDNSAATGEVSASGALASLGGSGTIGGAVTISSSATLGAGGDSTGLLTVANDVTIATTGIFSARINGETAGTDYDRVALTGGGSDFSLNGTNDLKLTLGYTPAANALFFLVDNQGGNAIIGSFDSLNGTTTDLSQGALFTVSGQDFHISYEGDVAGNAFTGGNDLVIQAVPEPSTALLLAAGLTTVVILRRRRA